MTIMNDLKFDRTVSAAFTGHRFYDFSQREFIQERLTSAISEAYDHGIRNFISGFALGIDLMAAQLVQSLKCNLPGISLTAAIPFEGQAERYNIYDKRVYRRLLELADKVIVLSDCYYPMYFLDRHDYMIYNPSYLIAYYDGRGKGGTYYTVKKARARSIPIINVY